MRFPGYTATTPPRSSGLARATNIGALTQTSEQAIWSGVGAFGRGLSYAGQMAFQAHQHRQALDDTIEWGTATSRVKDRFRLAADAAERLDVSMDMPAPDDPNYLQTLASFSTIKRDQFLTEALKDIEEDVSKLSQGFSNPKNKAEFENWYKNNYDNLASSVRSMYERKLDSYQRSEMSRLSETAAENGDVETADHFVDLMDKYELITPERAEVLKKNNKVIADTNITYLGARVVLSEKGLQAAKDFIMAQDVDIDIKKKLVTNINFEAAGQQDRLEILREKQRDEISDLIRAGKPVADLIENSALTQTEQDRYHDRARIASERQANRPYTQDKKMYWDILRKVTRNPDGVSEDDIADKVGYGLTTDDYKELTKIKDDKTTPLKTPRAQVYFNSLDALYENRETDAEERMKWDIANEKLVQFFEITKTPTANQAAEFYGDLIDPEILTWFDRAWQWSETSPLGTMYWYRKIRPKKEGEEDLINMTDEELEAIIRGK